MDQHEDGFVKVATLVGWLVKVKPALKTHEEVITQLSSEVLGCTAKNTEDMFAFPAFEKGFCMLLMQITLVLYGEKHMLHSGCNSKRLSESRSSDNLGGDSESELRKRNKWVLDLDHQEMPIEKSTTSIAWNDDEDEHHEHDISSPRSGRMHIAV